MDARKDDGAASATPLASSSSSTSSCSSGDGGREDEAEVFVEQRRLTEERTGDKEEKPHDEGGGCREGGSDGDDDCGYCTPTSPEHMIPPSNECPPAPMKNRWFRNLKRKAGVGGGLSSSAVQPVRVLDLSLELGEFVQPSKKARREASIAE